jgi:hypothetical protein
VKNVYHSGSTAGYRAHLNRFPESHTSVAVLCNASDGEATRSANDVSRVYLGKPYGIISGVAGGISNFGRPPATPVEPRLNDFVGDYWSDDAETKLTAQIDKDRLVLRRRPGTVISLELVGNDQFRGQIGTVTFHRNASGAVESLGIKQDRVWDLRFARQN